METGLIKGFTTAAEQNAFLAIIIFGSIAAYFLVRFLLIELRDGRKQTNSILETFNKSIVEYTKATTELTIEIKHHVKSK